MSCIFVVNYGTVDSREVLTREEKLVHQVEQGNLSAVIGVWVASKKCFVLGKNYARELEKKGKMDKIKSQGIPVYIRSSGGEAILHDESCLNFSIIVPSLKLSFYPFKIDRAFTILSSGIFRCLGKMKLPVYFGKTKIFCPGPYDLMVKEKKIAGLSLLLRKKFCLLHGTLFVNTGPDYPEKLRIFYPSIQDEITSIRILLGKWIDMKSLSVRIINEYKRSLSIKES